MKCDECLPRIEEYVDGELDGRTTERVAAHLSTCAECTSEFKELQRDAEIYAHYQRDIEVTPAQWNTLRARIEQEKDALVSKPSTQFGTRLLAAFNPGRKFRPVFAAAALLLIVGLTAGIIYFNSRHPEAKLAGSPVKPTETLPHAAALPPGQSKEKRESTPEDNDREMNEPGQPPVVASNGARAPKRKRNEGLTVIHTRSRNPLQIISLQPASRSNGETGTNNNVQVQASRDRALDLTPTGRDAGQLSSKASDFTPPLRSLNFDSEIARHAEKAQLLLRSFRNVRLPLNTRSVDVSYEKEQSRKLLYQNITLRREAATRRDEPTSTLLNRLEPILLDIANLPNRAKARDVRSIEQHMEKKEIVATLQVRTLVAAN